MIPQLISNFFGACKEFFGFANKRSDLKNTPEMKKRDEAQKENDLKDDNEKIIADGDVTATRNTLSE